MLGRPTSRLDASRVPRRGRLYVVTSHCKPGHGVARHGARPSRLECPCAHIRAAGPAQAGVSGAESCPVLLRAGRPQARLGRERLAQPVALWLGPRTSRPSAHTAAGPVLPGQPPPLAPCRTPLSSRGCWPRACEVTNPLNAATGGPPTSPPTGLHPPAREN